MQSLRRLSLAALVLSFAQVVFGAVVRITGSGMGCGDYWPKCAGAWFPPHDRMDLIIEITHRYLALAVVLAVLGLLIAAFKRRSEPGVGGPVGVLHPAIIASILVIIAALAGAVTVKMALNPFIIATHLTIAMSLLATLAVALARSGGLGADVAGASPKTVRSAVIAVVLTLVTLIFGALTANLPEGAIACGGFPWCTTINAHGSALYVHVTHRILGFLLFGHLLGMAISAGKRAEPRMIRRAAWFAFGAAVVQVLVASAMIEMHFPPSFRSLHQAFGTLLWLAVVVLAILSSRGPRDSRAEPAMRKAA